MFSQFQLHTCTYQNYLEEPNPRETSERMNFNVIDKKQLIWKLFIYWYLMSFFHKKNVTKCLGHHYAIWTSDSNFLLAQKNLFGPAKGWPSFQALHLLQHSICYPHNLFFVLWNLMISWIVFILHRKIFPIHHTYIYSLVSYLFIKQDQMILTCNSAVASLMLSRFL